VGTPAEDLVAVVRLLVDDPRAVAVEAVEYDDGVELELEVAEDDRGKVIGRRGRTIDALRRLGAARGVREGRDHDVELVED